MNKIMHPDQKLFIRFISIPDADVDFTATVIMRYAVYMKMRKGYIFTQADKALLESVRKQLQSNLADDLNVRFSTPK